jgi:hypothetical protein
MNAVDDGLDRQVDKVVAGALRDNKNRRTLGGAE